MLNDLSGFKISIRFFLFLLLCSSCSGTATSLEKKRLPKTQSAKLLHFKSGIRSIYEDNKGNIWFGSHNEGLALYNGDTVQYFTTMNGLSDNQIRSIYEDRQGKIWFECGSGISFYVNEELRTPSTKQYAEETNWEYNTADLWFKSDPRHGYNALEKRPGIYRYDGSMLTYQTFPLDNNQNDGAYYSISTPFVNGTSGTTWWGMYGMVLGYDGSKFIKITNSLLGLNDSTGFLHVRAIFEDSKGQLWIGNNGIGAFKFDGKTAIRIGPKKAKSDGDKANSTMNRIFSISEDKQGNIWFGTYGAGVWKYDGTSFTNYSNTHGLRCKHIWTIYQSKNGDLWFGGAEPSGVYKYVDTSFVQLF